LCIETLIVHPENKAQLKAVKAFMKALKVDFITEKDDYNRNFIAKIEKIRQEIGEGKGEIIAVEDL
jgi:hypothetical protein